MGHGGKGKGAAKASHFQVKLGGEWKDYDDQEDKILKRAFMAGFPNAKFELRAQHYQYDFKKMVQLNITTGKQREIRAPHKWMAPRKPIVPAGPTMTVTVPPGSAGKTIQVPHPKFTGQMIAVNVPAGAKAGQAMLVPVPMGTPGRGAAVPSASPTAAPVAASPPAVAASAGSGRSTGAKVAGGVAGVAAVGGLAVGGALLGTSIAEHGAEATFDGIADAVTGAAEATGDALGDAGEAIGEFAGEAGDFIVDAADSAGDFIMDLF